jgi:hypothetical protein
VLRERHVRALRPAEQIVGLGLIGAAAHEHHDPTGPLAKVATLTISR